MVGFVGTTRQTTIWVICFFVVFLSAELLFEYLHNQQLLSTLEHTESYSTLALQHERIRYERMRLEEAKQYLEKKRSQLQAKEAEFLSVLDDETQSSEERTHFEEDLDVATKQVCKANHGKMETKVVLGIFSHSSHKERRDLFRNTVLRSKPSEREIVIKFVVADKEMLQNDTLRKQVSKESEQKGDILLLDVAPSFAEEFVLSGQRLKLFFHHLYDHYDFQYVVKIEDLSFVRIPALIETLAELPKRWVYWGYFVSGQRVISDTIHPLADPKYLEVNDRYACYANAAGFGLSKDLVDFVVLSSLEFQVWGYDDAQLGTWLSPVNISYVDVGDTAIWRSEGCVGCSCLEETTAIVHPVSDNTFFVKLHEESLKGKMCELPLFTKNTLDSRNRRHFSVRNTFTTNHSLLILSILGMFFFCFIIFAFVIARALKSSAEDVTDSDSDNE